MGLNLLEVNCDLDQHICQEEGHWAEWRWGAVREESIVDSGYHCKGSKALE
jgi:hypothetical protein